MYHSAHLSFLPAIKFFFPSKRSQKDLEGLERARHETENSHKAHSNLISGLVKWKHFLDGWADKMRREVATIPLQVTLHGVM